MYAMTVAKGRGLEEKRGCNLASKPSPDTTGSRNSRQQPLKPKFSGTLTPFTASFRGCNSGTTGLTVPLSSLFSYFCIVPRGLSFNPPFLSTTTTTLFFFRLSLFSEDIWRYCGDERVA